MQELENVTIDSYRIQHHLTRGGMSDIYLAEDDRTGEKVAIKLVHSSNGEYYERFRREVQAVAALKHKHILPVYAYGEYEEWYCLIAPYISYGTLHKRLEEGSFTPKEAGRILEQLGGALQFAHERNIIHRDIKPLNILLQDGYHVYLADFGLAKKEGEDTGLTVTGVMMGTPDYMAPELAEEAASPSSDIYALGVLLYQMLTGQVPFKANTPLGIFLKHVSERPLPPTKLNHAIPAPIEKVILHALEKNPRKRFRTVSDFVAAYQRALAIDTPVVHALEEIQTLATRVTDHVIMIKPGFKLRSRMLAAVALTAGALLMLPLSLGYTFYSAQSTEYRQVVPHVNAAGVGQSTTPVVTPTATIPTRSHTQAQRAGADSNGTNGSSHIVNVAPLSTSSQEEDSKQQDDTKGSSNAPTNSAGGNNNGEKQVQGNQNQGSQPQGNQTQGNGKGHGNGRNHKSK